MDKTELSPLNVEIKTLTLNGKKMTKSVFNQIELLSCFDQNMDFCGDEFYGYVNEKDERYLVFKVNNRLRKSKLSDYQRLKKLNRFPSFSSTEWFLKKCCIAYEDYDDDHLSFDERFSDHKRYDELVEKVSSFIKNIWDSQIFI